MTKENNQGMKERWAEFSKTVNADFVAEGFGAHDEIFEFIQSEISLLKKGIEEKKIEVIGHSAFDLPPFEGTVKAQGFNNGLDAALEVFRKAGE